MGVATDGTRWYDQQKEGGLAQVTKSTGLASQRQFGPLRSAVDEGGLHQHEEGQMPSKKQSNQRVAPEASWSRPRRAGTTRQRTVWVLLIALSVAVMAEALWTRQSQGAVPEAPCPPTPGVLPAHDVARGACLFHSRTAFGQDPLEPFATCATCHYGAETTDRGTHLVQITNHVGQTIEVLRRTPSLLNAPVNFPYGWDGRFPSVQEAAQHAIMSPVEMKGTFVTPDQLDALTAFVLQLPSPPAPPPPSATVLAAIARGKLIFNGKGQCVLCHPAPNFTNNTVTTDQVHANFTGTTDRGAGFVGTGPDGAFKVPSLKHFGALPPFMHNGALAKPDQLLLFYNKSLGLQLTPAEMSDLRYYLKSL